MPDNSGTFVALAISCGLVVTCVALYLIAKKCVNDMLDQQSKY